VPDIEPRTQRGAIRQNKLLQLKIEGLEEDLKMLEEQLSKLTTEDVPAHVKKWMNEYKLPWQVFWCCEHEEWIIGLDTCFPYHIEQCECPKC